MTKAKNSITSYGTTRTFLKVGTCSETLFNVLDRAFDQPMPIEEHAATPFAGGIMQHGYQCGQIWGVALAAGARAYQLYGAGPQAEVKAILAAQRLVESFRARNHHINCQDITGIDKSASTGQMIHYFLVKLGVIRCFHMAAKYAPIAFDEINTVFSENPTAAPTTPVSCAALLAEKMGATDKHRVMAAGLAGGIGLCGGACGALGAAIWIGGMNQGGKIDYQNPKAIATVERFSKCTDSKFPCSEIIGRRFTGIEDHAEYLRHGGCAEIIAALASA